jgi:hypothetical protein
VILAWRVGGLLRGSVITLKRVTLLGIMQLVRSKSGAAAEERLDRNLLRWRGHPGLFTLQFDLRRARRRDIGTGFKVLRRGQSITQLSGRRYTLNLRRARVQCVGSTGKQKRKIVQHFYIPMHDQD